MKNFIIKKEELEDDFYVCDKEEIFADLKTKYLEEITLTGQELKTSGL